MFTGEISSFWGLGFLLAENGIYDPVPVAGIINGRQPLGMKTSHPSIPCVNVR